MIKSYYTIFGTYKTGLFQSRPGGRWYGKELDHGRFEFMTKEEFEIAINKEKPELEPLPF